jgi:hypothetical protein
MPRIATILLPVLALLGRSDATAEPLSRGVILAPVPDREEKRVQLESLARYCFNGDARDENKKKPESELRNTQFKDNALYLNGLYDGGNKDGFRAVCRTPKLDYTQFTVALRFKPEACGQRKDNLVTGGTSYRWFGMSRSPTGNLTITLNNQDFSHEIKGAAIDPGKWTVVACGIDLGKRKIAVYLNGKRAADIDLPAEFKLRIIDANVKEQDKVWTFTSYSNGNVFHGLVDELIIYGEMLSPREFAAIPLSP